MVKNIDGVRGVAVLMVFLFHSRFFLFPPDNGINSVFDIPVQDLKFKEIVYHLSPFSYGWSGVQLFLLISGFLIHYTNFDSISGKEYFIKRVFRIYPLYLVALILYFAVEGNVFSISDFSLHALLINNLFGANFFSIGPHFWSLGLEFQLYILYFFVWKYTSAKHFYTLFLVSFFVAITSILVISYYHLTTPNFTNSVGVYWPIWLSGAELAIRYKTNNILKFNPILPIVILLCTAFLGPRIPIFWLQPYMFSIAFYMLISHVLVTNLTMSLWSFLIYIGKIGYGFYLFHVIFLKLVPEIKLFNLVNYSTVFSLFDISAVFLLIMIVSDFMYENYEKKWIDYGKKLAIKFRGESLS